MWYNGLVKTCQRCKVEKEISAFYPDPRYKGGHQNNCRVCKNSYAKEANRKRRGSQPHVLVNRSSRRHEDRGNRLEWRKLQRSIAHINIESNEEEIARLVEEQARDDRTYQIKHSFAYDTTNAPKNIEQWGMVIYDDRRIHAT